MQRDGGSPNVGPACAGDATSAAYARAGLMSAMNAGQMRPNCGGGNTYPGMSTGVAGAAPHQNTATVNAENRPALEAVMGGMGR